MVKNPPAKEGDTGSVPGSGRSPEKRIATHSSIPAWRIPKRGDPGRLQSMVSQRDMTESCVQPSRYLNTGFFFVFFLASLTQLEAS